MKTFHSAKELRQDIRRQKRVLTKACDKVAKEIKDRFVAQARNNSPKNSLKMQQSIQAQKQGVGSYVITAGYRGNQGFDVGGFTNKAFKITTRKPNRYFAQHQTFRYGDSAVFSPSFNRIKWTANNFGARGWWEWTTISISEYQYPPEFVGKLIMDEVRKSS